MNTEARDRSDIDRAAWIIIGIAVVAFWLITTSGRPWDLFARAGYGADFYDEQARVFLRGRLAVNPDVPGPEGFLIGGSTYLYYGPFLSIVRMPFILFGDLFVGRLVRISMLTALVVLGRWALRLALLAGSLVARDDVRPGPPVVFVAAVMFSPALFAAGWVSVYNETELWALTLAVVTITLTAEWVVSNFSDRRTLVMAGAAAMATALTRAPIGFGVAFTLGACGLVLFVRSLRDTALRTTAVLAVGAGTMPLVAHAIVNRAKFGTWMSVPGDQQLLSLTNPTRAAWFAGNDGSFFSLRFFPTTMIQYWRPDAVRFERLVPGVRFGPLARDYGSYPVESSTPASSLTTSALLLLVLAIAGVVWLLRHRAKAWTLIVVGATLGAVPTFLIGFIANRYLMDMLPPLIAAGSVGVWVMAQLPRPRPVAVGAVLLATWGLWSNASLAIWNLELKSPGFTEARFAIDEAVFGGGHDSLITIEPGDPAPRDGIVGIVADCSGVWIAEQGNWVALDRAEGVRTISGTTSGGPELLAVGDSWALAIEQASGELELTFREGSGQFDFAHPLAPGVQFDYDVVVDDVVGFNVVHVGDAEFFLAPESVDGNPDIRPVKSAPAPLSNLCTSLAPK